MCIRDRTNSSVPLSDTGSGPNALICHSHRSNCCQTFSLQPQGVSEWFFPNGSNIPSGRGSVFSRNRTDQGVINLNRTTDATPPSGMYCCRVMDILNVEQTVCVNVGQ